MHTKFWSENLKGHSEDVGVDGRILLTAAQDRDQWRILVKAVMNLRVP